MEKREALSENELISKIRMSEDELKGDLWVFWQLIKISPERWNIQEFRQEGKVWVVAIFAREIIWYNDVEKEYYISNYKEHGKIDEQLSCQDKLAHAVSLLYDLIRPKEDSNLLGYYRC